MYGYIYKFTNLINNKVYIGKHKYPKAELDKNYLTSGVLIKQAIQKYGLESFKQDIVCTCETLEELNAQEIHFIKEYDCISPNGYNLTKGGDGISEPTLEILEKNRIWHLGRKQSKESSIKKSIALKGRPKSEGWKQKISKANKGQVIADSTRRASSIRHKGTHWYNNGTEEFMLFDTDDLTGLNKGRLKKK